MSSGNATDVGDALSVIGQARNIVYIEEISETQEDWEMEISKV